MDHISKALEKNRADQKNLAQSGRTRGVRDWVRPDAIGSNSDIPALGFKKAEIDLNILRGNHVLLDTGDPVALDRYRLLRTRVLQLMSANRWSSLGVTSPGAREGKTLTSINLAMAIARDGAQRVFLIDADLRKPSIAKTLGVQSESGVLDFLREDADLSDIMFTLDGIENLVVLPGRQDIERPAESELLRSKRITVLFDQIHKMDRNALVLVDFPPVLVADDVIALAPLLDSILLVIADGQTDVDQLASAAELLSEYNLLGTALNRCTENTSASEGYYGYYQDAPMAQED